MNKLRRSWLLFKCSASVVLQNKKLLVFPALSFVFTTIILFLAITPVAFQSTGYKLNQGEHWKAIGSSLFATQSIAPGDTSTTKVTFKPLAIGIGAAIYMLAMFLATFFNVAFFHQILHTLKGEPVSVQAGFKFAVSKLKAIALWSLFAGLIGLIIKVLEERLEAVGRLIMRFVGLAWSVACVFVIPVLIVEPGSNPFDTLRKSAATLKKTWGESLAGYLGLQFGSTLVVLCSLLFLGGALVVAIMAHSLWIFLVGVVLSISAMIVFAYLTNVASQVYRCALYIYAAEGAIPAPYNDELLQMAWKLKKA